MPTLLALGLVGVQIIAGTYLWAVMAGARSSWLERLGMGLALGTALAALSGVLFWVLLPSPWTWTLSLLIPVLVYLVRSMKARTLRLRIPPARRVARAPAATGLITGLGVGLVTLLVNVRAYPLGSDDSRITYHPDMFFFEALSTSLARFGPFDSIFMSGAEIRYHWLVYAWSGQVSESAAAEPFLVLTRILPIVALIGSVVLAVAWTQRLTRGFWAPSLAAVLIVFGGYVGATYGTILNFDSPSQQMATVWLLALSLSLMTLIRQRGSSLPHRVTMLALIALVAAATTGGKASAGAVAIAAWGFTTLIALVRREKWARRALMGLIAAGAGTLVFFAAFITGSAQGGGLGLGSLLDKASSVQGLNPVESSWGILLGTMIFVIAMAPRWAGVVWLVIRPRSRWKPFTTFSVGMVIAAVSTMLLISGGLNDTWFALAASAPLSIASAVGVSRAIEFTTPSTGPRVARSVIWCAVAAAALLAGVALLWSFGPGSSPFLRWLAPLTAAGGAIIMGRYIGRRSPSHRHSRWVWLASTLTILVLMAAGGRILSIASGGFGVQPESGFNPTEFTPVTAFVDSIDRVSSTDLSSSTLAAADWVRANTSPADLLATNLTFGATVPALTGRQTFISGLGYQAPYGLPDSLSLILERESITHDFVNNPGVVSAEVLCSSGVDLIWVDPARTRNQNWAPFASVVYATESATLLQFNGTTCATP